jgi:hypothetical protein
MSDSLRPNRIGFGLSLIMAKSRIREVFGIFQLIGRMLKKSAELYFNTSLAVN